jgi:hypothetical protein
MYEIWILILSIFHVIYGYPDGAPERACFYMIPRHTHPHTGLPVLKQRAAAPYRITVDNTTFRSNSAIRGNIFFIFLNIILKRFENIYPVVTNYLRIVEFKTCKNIDKL